MRRGFSILAAVVVLASMIPLLPAVAAPIAADPLARAWERTDKPVADGQVSRTWMWGPEPFTEGMMEEYAESPDGQRFVQYFDKSRMEITNPNGDQNSIWYVTNGLLVTELVTGRMQTGDNTFIERSPAQINVAGDFDDPNGPTYASFRNLMDDTAGHGQEAIRVGIARDGSLYSEDRFAAYGIGTSQFAEATQHWIADPFWSFMNSTGMVYENAGLTTAPLFENPYYATGLPIVEPFWSVVRVGGVERDVLVQCFERRCLTYTPDNPTEWQVEAGNVGQHYHAWRYAGLEPGPSERANTLANRVTSAANDDERIDALMDVMAALNVGVYTGEGQKLLGGAERGAGDFYLYDYELYMMSEAIERKQTFGLIDLAMQISTLELTTDGQELDPAVVRSALLGATDQAAANPNADDSLALLLVRQLGLAGQQPYDLFTDAALETIRLDPLSYFILFSAATMPSIGDELPIDTSGSQFVANSNGVLTLSSAQPGPCDPTYFEGDAFKNAYGWSKNFADLMALIPKSIGKATAIFDAVHGAILAYSVQVTSLQETQSTHYGHEEPGAPMTFKIKVVMLDELPEVMVKCGWIAGTDFPPAGPIKDVSVHWFWQNLDEHGTVSCGQACLGAKGNALAIDATGADGVATMTFHPKQETSPETGWVVEEYGTVTGIALYQSKFTNLLGAYGQYLTPKSGDSRWQVSWHQEAGWDVILNVDYDIDSTWKHIGFDAADDYFEEVINGSGEMTFTGFIPMSLVDQETQLFAWGTATGTGSADRISTDYSAWSAYEHWEWDCEGTYTGNWDSPFMIEDIYADGAGNRTVMIDQLMEPNSEPLWTVSGWYSVQGPMCYVIVPHATVEDAIVHAVPAFSLDVVGEQEFTVNAQEICGLIRTQMTYFDGNANQPNVLQSCSGDVEWTIEVTSRQQP